MKAEIISIGTELLIGSIVNTNARFLSEKLAENAFDVYFQTTVGDNPGRIAEAFRIAATRADLVISSGGLGPTADDATLEGLSDALNLPLKYHGPTARHIGNYLKKRGRRISRINAKQCYLPSGAVVLKNAYGTAPGIVVHRLIDEKKKLFLALPGPPGELEPMFLNQALPVLNSLCQMPKEYFLVHTIKIAGLSETRVAQKVNDLLTLEPPLTVGIYAKPDEVELRVMAKSSSLERAKAMVLRTGQTVRSRLKKFVYGVDASTLSSATGELLQKHKNTVSIAESCTGGLCANLITDAPGSSEYFMGGVIAYANAVKIRELNVPSNILSRRGAVSAEVARAMAKGIRRRFDTDYGLAITGVAGPSGGSEKKPVGLVYIALSETTGTSVTKHRFFGCRKEIKYRAAHRALDLLRLRLLEKHPSDQIHPIHRPAN